MKHLTILFYVAILCVFLTACIEDGKAQEYVAHIENDKAQEIFNISIPKDVVYKETDSGIVILALGMSRAEIEQILGKPEKEQKGYIYPGENECFYDENTISLLYKDDAARSIFLKVKADWSIWGDVKPGALLSDVEKVFGEQLNIYDSAAVYWVNANHKIIADVTADGNEDYSINFLYEYGDDRVTEISIAKA